MHLQAAGDGAAWQRPPFLGGGGTDGRTCSWWAVSQESHINGHLLTHFSSISVLFKTASVDVDALMLSHI